MKAPVEDLLKASGVDLFNCGGFEELELLQEYLSDYKIVFHGLNPDRVDFLFEREFSLNIPSCAANQPTKSKSNMAWVTI